jgi:hypothetical protein
MEKSKSNPSHKERGAQNSGMTNEQVYNFALKSPIIPILSKVAERIGREKFVEMLREASDEYWFDKEKQNEFFRNMSDEFRGYSLDTKVLENTEETRTYKMTKCLWANAFRESGAADIGYAIYCQSDYAIARHDNEKLERNKTLMQGDDCCLMKWSKKI